MISATGTLFKFPDDVKLAPGLTGRVVLRKEDAFEDRYGVAIKIGNAEGVVYEDTREADAAHIRSVNDAFAWHQQAIREMVEEIPWQFFAGAEEKKRTPLSSTPG